MNNVLQFINFENDKWLIPSRDDLSDYTFDFSFIESNWLKNTIKKITRETISIGRLTNGTIHRYFEALPTFFGFIDESTIEFNLFSDISPKVIEQYIFYLLTKIEKPSTRSVKLAGLKHYIKHGQLLGWSGFPKKEVFDGTERRTLQSKDALKSMVIEDGALANIDKHLELYKENNKKHNDVLFWGLITIIRHTGVRIHEALALHENSLRKDLMGKWLLEICSEKNLTDRYIPVSKEVADAIRKITDLTSAQRKELDTDKLFIYYMPRKKCYEHLNQKNSRVWLNYFLKNYQIIDTSGSRVFHLTYHQFRHTIGTDMINNGFSISEVMQYLGHDSMHSTRLYAKIRNDRLAREYEKLGFIGKVVEKVKEVVTDNEKRLMAQLPDGVCGRPIDDKVIDCKKPNACLFCPKFITTPEFLAIHKDHLKRLKVDKKRYLEENLIGTDYLLHKAEEVLEEIIQQLESLIENKEVKYD